MQTLKKTALVWFRNDLRTLDHYGLSTATASHEKVIAYYSFDPRHYTTTKWGFKKTERYRAHFLIDTVRDLQQRLRELNITLIVDLNTPETGLSQVIAAHQVETVYLQEEWTTEETKVVAAVQTLCPTVAWETFYGQFLFPPTKIPFAVENMPEVFTAFRKKVEKYTNPPALIPPPKAMPQDNLLAATYEIPKLATLGLSDFEKDKRSAFPFDGGTTAGLHRMQEYFWNTKKLSYYKQTRNGLVGVDYSSKFSPWLANGALSPTMIYWEVKRYEKEVDKNQSTYWLVFELLWRDFFKYISLKHGNKIFQQEGILNRAYHWDNSPKKFVQWAEGETHEPFVNANMLELKHTGWMSNRGRQNVASYFAKNLLLDWRMGAAYFEALLLDYDVHSNYGNWMYVAGVGNDPRDRKFNVQFQAERYDPKGAFQKLWLQLNLFP